MHEVPIKAWIIAIAFCVGFGANELLAKLLRYLETTKK